MRFKILAFLCMAQIIAGVIIAGLSVVFPAAEFFIPNPDIGPINPALLLAVAIGGIFLGLSLIAMAQVYQCLMQIEINTRPVQLQPDLATQGTRGIGDNPLAVQV